MYVNTKGFSRIFVGFQVRSDLDLLVPDKKKKKKKETTSQRIWVKTLGCKRLIPSSQSSKI